MRIISGSLLIPRIGKMKHLKNNIGDRVQFDAISSMGFPVNPIGTIVGDAREFIDNNPNKISSDYLDEFYELKKGDCLVVEVIGISGEKNYFIIYPSDIKEA